MQAGTPAELVKGPNVLKNRVPGVPIPPGQAFPSQVTRLTISPHSISLRRIRRGQRAWRDCGVGATRTRWHGNMDCLAPIWEGEIQVKFNLGSAGEIVGGLDLEWRRIRGNRIDRHTGIIRAALYDSHTRSGCRQRRRACRRVSAAVVLQRDIQINALIPVDDAITVAYWWRVS